MSEERPLVKPTSGMDADTFLKHINARHTPIGGLKKMGKSIIPDDENEDLLRAYHKYLHRHEGEKQNHTHGKPKKESK